MKIALVCPYDFAYPGGVVVHVTQLARSFIQRGHTVKIIAPLSGRPPDLPHREDLIALGPSIPLPTGGSTARVSVSFWLAPRIRRLLQQEQFDLIHLHEPLASFLPLSILSCSQAVNVGTFHANHGSRHLYWMSHRPLQHWSRKLDGRIAVSEAALTYVNKYFPGEYRTIPNGIDAAYFSNNVRPLPAFQDGKINILFVGRIREKRKGLKFLLGAYSRLKWRYPNIRLLVVGPGQPNEECLRMIDERNARDVHFLGSIPYDELPSYYHAAHIFCAPNLGKESFGIVLLEAMAAAKPVVASDIAGFSSVLRHGAEGMLVPPQDEEALAAALEPLLVDEELRQTLGAQGLRRAQEFDWSRVSAQVLDYYDTLLRNRRPVPEPIGS